MDEMKDLNEELAATQQEAAARRSALGNASAAQAALADAQVPGIALFRSQCSPVTVAEKLKVTRLNPPLHT